MDQLPATSPTDLLGSAGRILVLEPDTTALDVICTGLQAATHQVIACTSADQAWEHLNRDAFDLILSEIVLPKQDGFAFVTQVRKNSATHLIPFLFLASDRKPSSRLKALQLGADDYIVKPCVLSELQAKVKNILRRARMIQAKSGSAGLDGQQGLSGAVEVISCQELLQFFESVRKTGLLLVHSPRAVGKIFLEKGQIYSAAFADIEGEEAVYLMFACREGRFEYRPDLQPPGERNVHLPLQSMLLEGLRLMDETDRVLVAREARATPSPAADDSARQPSGVRPQTSRESERSLRVTRHIRVQPPADKGGGE